MKLQRKTFRHIKMILIIFGVAVIGFVLGKNQLSFPSFLPSQDTVSAKQLANMLKTKTLPAGGQGFTLVNVHIPYEGEIEKTDTFIAYDQIVANSGSLPKDKNASIILYCKTGRMSTEALVTVRKLGYTNVKHLSGGMDAWQKSGETLLDLSTLESQVLPKDGIELPVSWKDLGPQLIKLGVIDEAKFKKAVKLTPEQENILTKNSEEKIRIDAKNSQFIVDMLWALGLAQKSIVYDEGPLGKEYKKEAGNFASTGGWNLARGEAMQYLNRFDLIPLTQEQQKKVGEITQNVYRPCCGNSTWFPDCNHGMAALAIIELLVAQNVDETTIYKYVLGFNSFWFPDSYLYVATYFARQAIPWDQVDAKMILAKEYSSGQGSQVVAKKVGQLPWRPASTGGSCGV